MENLEQNDLSHLTSVNKCELEDLIKFSKTVKVLYVDNDTDIRNDFYGIFKIFFDEIDVASNGKEGFEKFKVNKYDLIITALDIEPINGVEMISNVREKSKDITILVLSSHEEYYLELIRLGIDGYIISPIEVKQFVLIMKKVIITLQNKQAIYEYRKNLEYKNKELLEINKNLESRVKEEVEKNRQKDIQVFEHAKLTAIGDMLGNIAHQWRQPLSVISTATTGVQIEKEMGMLSDEHLDDSLKVIHENTKYLSNIIDIFSESIKDDEVKQEIILQEKVNSIVDIVKNSFNELNIDVINEVNKYDPVAIEISTGKLSQVLLNILNNAKDALIERNIDDPWIKIDFYFEENISITIEDNAQGISKDIFSKIFEPYFTTKHQSLGKGLSLHLCYKMVVEELEGKLYVQNTDDGAKFFIEISY